MSSWLQGERASARLERSKPVFHPNAGEAWFRTLPHADRARMNREWRAGLQQDERLQRASARKLLRSGARHALGFALLNGFCPGDRFATYLLAACVGMVLAVALEWLRAARLLSSALGMLVFGAFQLVTRGGLSIALLFWLVPAGALCTFLAIEREE